MVLILKVIVILCLYEGIYIYVGANKKNYIDCHSQAQSLGYVHNG